MPGDKDRWANSTMRRIENSRSCSDVRSKPTTSAPPGHWRSRPTRGRAGKPRVWRHLRSRNDRGAPRFARQDHCSDARPDCRPHRNLARPTPRHPCTRRCRFARYWWHSGHPATYLAYECKGLLSGESTSRAVVSEIERIIAERSDIYRLTELLTMHFGPHDILLNASLDFADRLSSTEVENNVSSLEQRIKTRFPDVKRIFIEAHTHRLSLANPLTKVRSRLHQPCQRACLRDGLRSWMSRLTASFPTVRL